VDPVDWTHCKDPHDASEEARPAKQRGKLTPYAVDRGVQRRLAALRTDLDSFSDLEALALMTSAYAMTSYEFPRSVQRFPAPSGGPTPWHFQLALRDWIETPVRDDDPKLKMLEVGSSLAFKLWRIDSALRIVAAIFGLALLAFLVWVCTKWWSTSLSTVL